MPAKTHIHLTFFAIALFLGVCNRVEATSPEQPGLLPAPQSVEWNGKSVPLASVRISFQPGKSDSEKTDQIMLELKELLAVSNIQIDQDGAGHQIVLKLGNIDVPRQPDEAYKLVADKNGITITANTVSGLYYGVQTLRQLIVS
jgi:N-acetyl-beta-hexosaminidase